MVCDDFRKRSTSHASISQKQYKKELKHRRTIAKKHNLVVIEDTAQAFGATCHCGGDAGMLSDAGTFSFYKTKNDHFFFLDKLHHHKFY